VEGLVGELFVFFFSPLCVRSLLFIYLYAYSVIPSWCSKREGGAKGGRGQEREGVVVKESEGEC
jgi:hypothetical protein